MRILFKIAILGLLTLSLFLLLNSITTAHLAGGEDFVVEEYLIDFGHDPEILEVYRQ